MGRVAKIRKSAGHWLEWSRRIVTRRPAWVVAAWLATALAVGLLAPDLTRLAAEGQAKLLPREAESALAADEVREAWPDQWSESNLVAVLRRPGGLSEADRAFARRLSDQVLVDRRPGPILRVIGPRSPGEVAARLVSRDGSTQLIIVPMATSFVSPATHAAVAWIEERVKPAPGPVGLVPPPGLELQWSGDAVIGRDYMGSVQASLDRAAVMTVVLLLGVLLFVYRSLWLAAVPLATIGVGLVISRGLLAWLTTIGWEISPLVELFLIVVLFGSGTDFCLFLSWRFGEHWNPSNPAGAMRATLRRAFEPIVTSAGTVIVGLSLMGTTRFKLFSSTGPSVALGLALTVVATLTLTPALLVLLAKYRPRSYRGLTAPASGFWDEIGHKVLARPVRTWLGTVALMLPVAVVGLRSGFIQDTFSELPAGTPSVEAMKRIADEFGAGVIAPLTVVVRADEDLRQSRGLALIDDVSRHLAHLRSVVEVRSATQPLGSTEPLEAARLSARLLAVNDGFGQIAEGANQLKTGLIQGAGKLRAAILFERLTGVPLTGPISAGPSESNPGAGSAPAARESMLSGLQQATASLLGVRSPKPSETAQSTDPKANPAEAATADPRGQMLRELALAADGATQIADGARRARREVAAILDDPVGHRALDRLLITQATVQDHPELLRSFAAYLSPDGRLARFDLTQSARIFSAEAMEQVHTVRRRLREYLDEDKAIRTRALVTGPNAESADIWDLTRSDQYQTWVIVPAGVFLILLLALRDPWACVNLVATMLLTYAFALGATHLVFVNGLGAEGLDWKVPYFLFVLLVAVGVDYNVFLMTRLREEAEALGLKSGINRAVAQTGGLISSAAAITACSFASFLSSPLGSIRQLGFALVVGITIDAVLIRPLLVPCGHWLLNRHRERRRPLPAPSAPIGRLARVAD